MWFIPGLYLIFITLATVVIKKRTQSVAPGAVMAGVSWRYIGEL